MQVLKKSIIIILALLTLNLYMPKIFYAQEVKYYSEANSKAGIREHPLEIRTSSEEEVSEKKKSRWWLWALLGAVVIGGGAAAAGGSGGGDSSSTSNTGGSATVSW
jgi:hypothetical protein